LDRCTCLIAELLNEETPRQHPRHNNEQRHSVTSTEGSRVKSRKHVSKKTHKASAKSVAQPL